MHLAELENEQFSLLTVSLCISFFLRDKHFLVFDIGSSINRRRK